MTSATVDTAAERLARLLTGQGGALRDAEGSDLVFEPELVVRSLGRGPAPADVWAVDGGQSSVADARCVQLVVTRAARVRWRHGRIELEEEGELHAQLIGCGEEAMARATMGLPVRPDNAIDINLLRDWDEWQAVGRCLDEADDGALVLIDGDLQPDWRIPSTFIDDLLRRAASRGILLVGVTKHTSLSRGGAPLLAVLERQAEHELGSRSMWWVPVARTRPDVGHGIRVVAARLDPDARFSFRIDLPGEADPEVALGTIAALADDAAFPGYPYPLSLADRIAACPGWLRADLWARVEDGFDREGVPHDVRERAFSDRHRMMERA